MNEIILASGSPRRKELLTLAGIPFHIEKSSGPEVSTQTEPGEIVKELSAHKALDVVQNAPEGVTVLGADTIVWADGEVLGKPESREDARRMLKLLQGKAHSVFTGVTLAVSKGGTILKQSFYSETKVHVHTISDEEIEAYIDTGDPFDKAGAYGIQGPFAVFVDGIEGDYLTVVGLPLAAVYQALKTFPEIS